MLGLNDDGQLVAVSWSGAVVKVIGPIILANSWTQVASTYNLAHGLRLYANESLHNLSSAFSFQASGTPNYLFVGSPRAAIHFPWWSDITGQYSGAVDEFQVYSSRENSLRQKSAPWPIHDLLSQILCQTPYFPPSFITPPTLKN